MVTYFWAVLYVVYVFFLLLIIALVPGILLLYFKLATLMNDVFILQDSVANKWVIPIIQGYCKIAHCINTFEEEDLDEGEDRRVAPFPPEEFDLVLISRRSVFRAGKNIQTQSFHCRQQVL